MQVTAHSKEQQKLLKSSREKGLTWLISHQCLQHEEQITQPF